MTGSTDVQRRRGLVLLLLTVAAVLAPCTVTTAARAQAPSDASGPLVVHTVPPVPGFPVTLGTTTVLTDSQGRAPFDTAAGGLTLEPTEKVLEVDGQPVKVSADRLYTSGEEPRLALTFSYLVQFRFSTTDGTPVPGSSIDAFTVKSATGEVAELPADEPSWLQGTRVTMSGAALEVRPVEWSVQRAERFSSNLVNASQQTFLPAEVQTVPVDLLVFGMGVRVRDAVFGFVHGGSVELVYPDGHRRRFDLDAEGGLELSGLPRGDYTLAILGAGPRIARPVAVSRDQLLDLRFHSWVDIGVVLGGLSLLAVALAWAGHGRRRTGRSGTANRSRHAARDSRRGEPAADGAPVLVPASRENAA